VGTSERTPNGIPHQAAALPGVVPDLALIHGLAVLESLTWKEYYTGAFVIPRV